MKVDWDVVIAGGGFFGCALAVHLKERGLSVLLCEREPELLQRASYNNQARVHNGYHYPRSILTALRSRVNFPRFIKEYEGCIDSSFEHYYAIPKIGSKVSSRQFRLFMERIGAPIQLAPPSIKKMFNGNLIEEVFQVQEYAFDSSKLKEMIRNRMEKCGVELWIPTEIRQVLQSENINKRSLDVIAGKNGADIRLNTRWLLNCTYSNLNRLLDSSALPRLRLKQELTEMALVEQPQELQGKAVTVMCGSFFSTMPFPSRNQHTLSHVRYTPHCSWAEGPDLDYRNAYEILRDYPKQSRFEHMRHDAARYLPALASCRQTGSLWELKTVLPQSELDDSRPILFKAIPERPGLFCIMGGKIDNIYDAYEELDGAGILKI